MCCSGACVEQSSLSNCGDSSSVGHHHHHHLPLYLMRPHCAVQAPPVVASWDPYSAADISARILLRFNQHVRSSTLTYLRSALFIPDVVFCFFFGGGWLDSRVVSVLDSGAEGPGFKSQSRRCWVTVLGKLFTPIVPLFTKQQNWQQPAALQILTTPLPAATAAAAV